MMKPSQPDKVEVFSQKIHLFFVFGTVLFLSGCSDFAYYRQAVSGHLDLLNRKQNIRKLLESPQTPPELKRKLKLVESVRNFAVQKLALPENKGYTGYVDLERSYVTMVVTAAPALELKAYRWCYRFIGCQEYRGYFDENEAKNYARKMEQQQFDISVRPVSAYSTLGLLNQSWLPDYFSDPVLNTFLNRRDVDLIATLIHETAHQIIYLKNDTSFNESFAVFVEQEGLRQFLLESGKSKNFADNGNKLYQWYLKARKDREQFRKLVGGTYKKMKTLFASEIPEIKKLRQKQQLFLELRENYQKQKSTFQVLSYDSWFAQKLNNTHLLGVRRYRSKVKMFAKLFEEQGRSWPEFYQAVRELAKKSS